MAIGATRPTTNVNYILEDKFIKVQYYKIFFPFRIKQGMLNAIVNEQEKSVRSAIVQFVGVLVKHEFNKKDSWMNDVLKFIFEHCSSNNPQQSEVGLIFFF